MDSAFFNSWNLDRAKTTGKEEFAKVMGVDNETFAMLDKLGVTMTISKAGDDTYKFDVSFQGDNAPAPSSYTATVGKSVSVPTLDGTKAELVLSIEGAAVREDYKTEKGNFTLTRNVSGNQMVAVSVTGGVTLTQYFNKA